MAKNEINKKIADIFDLPPDIILGLPRITLIGKIQLYIENHNGIILYERDCIRVKTRDGEIVVEGDDLKLRTVYHDDIYIEGVIDSIALEGNAQ